LIRLTHIYLKLLSPIDELLKQPTHTIERWLLTADKRIKDSIKRQRLYTQQAMQPIRNFFQRVVPPQIIRQRRQPYAIQNIQPNRNDNRNNIAEEDNNLNNQNAVIAAPRHRNFITRSITTFFRPLQYQHPDP
jgi:hypothetical protein